MPRPENWRELTVWRCAHCAHEERWASAEATQTCPTCEEPAERAGFTWGEAVDAENKFDCTIAVAYSIPVPELVPLSTLPRELWEGLPAYHPMSQRDVDLLCDWRRYDVGVVVSVAQDSEVEGGWRCCIQGSIADHGWELCYPPSNLWVPKALAERLGAPDRG